MRRTRLTIRWTPFNVSDCGDDELGLVGNPRLNIASVLTDEAGYLGVIHELAIGGLEVALKDEGLPLKDLLLHGWVV